MRVLLGDVEIRTAHPSLTGAIAASSLVHRGHRTIDFSSGDATMSGMPADRILRLDAVLERTGLSRATLYRKIHDGTFPRQVRIATRCTGWRESAVNEWMQNPMFYTVDDN
jgi:prophage regulatory protein